MANTSSSITVDLEKSKDQTYIGSDGKEYLKNYSGSTTTTTGGSAITIPGDLITNTLSYGKLDQFVESLPFIAFILGMTIFISMGFGAKALTYFLIVLLVSMVIFNQGKLNDLFAKITF